jgi:hypothetical protein
VTHPWLGDGLPHIQLHASVLSNGTVEREIFSSCGTDDRFEGKTDDRALTIPSLEESLARLKNSHDKRDAQKPQALVGLLLACYLAEHQGGKIVVQGSPGSGYRYVLQLPKIETDEIGSPREREEPINGTYL